MALFCHCLGNSVVRSSFQGSSCDGGGGAATTADVEVLAAVGGTVAMVITDVRWPPVPVLLAERSGGLATVETSTSSAAGAVLLLAEMLATCCCCSAGGWKSLLSRGGDGLRLECALGGDDDGGAGVRAADGPPDAGRWLAGCCGVRFGGVIGLGGAASCVGACACAVGRFPPEDDCFCSLAGGWIGCCWCCCCCCCCVVRT